MSLNPLAMMMMAGMSNQRNVRSILNKSLNKKKGTEYARRCVRTSKAVGATTWTDIELNTPVDVIAGAGVAMRTLLIEGVPLMDTDADLFKIVVSRNDQTAAEAYIDREDVYGKISWETVDHGTAGNARVHSKITSISFNPPAKMMGQNIHVAAYSTEATTLYLCLIFSFDFMTIEEMLESIFAIASYG